MNTLNTLKKFCIFTSMNSFLGIFGIFDRVAQLRENPLLADIYKDIDALRNGEFELALPNRYVGPQRDFENFRKDKENLARDFNKAFKAAKVKLGV